MSFLSRFFGKGKSEKRSSLISNKKLRMESLESRELLSVSPLGTDTDSANLYNNQAYFGEDAYSQEAITAATEVEGLAAEAITNESVKLSWTAFADTEGYEIQYSNDGETWTGGFEVDKNETSDTIPGLSAATTYQFQIRAKTGSGQTTWSSSLTVTTDDAYYGNKDANSAEALGAVEGEKSVENLVIVAGTEDYFSFTTNGVCTEDHFVKINFTNSDGTLALELLDDQGTVYGSPYETDPADAGDGYLIISLKDLAADTYMVKISGDDAAVSNTYSLDFNVYHSEAWLKTFKATTVTKDSVVLGWTDPAVANGLELEYSTDQKSWAPVTGVDLADEAATIDTLDPVTTYYFRIRAVTGTSEYSAWSEVLTVMTDDVYSGNNALDDAEALNAIEGEKSVKDLVIVAGKPDYFSFTTNGVCTEDHFVKINFTEADGPLALELLDDQGDPTSYTATPENGSLIISLKDLAADTYIVKISGAGDDAATVSNTYSLDFNVYTWLDTFKATTVTKDSIDLAWDNAVGNEGYEIQYSTDPAFPVGDDTLTDAPAQGETSATIDSLTAVTTYYVRIRAKTGSDTYSEWSSRLTVMTDDAYYGNNAVGSAEALGTVEGEKSVADLVILAGTEDYFRFTTNGACTKDHFVKINFTNVNGTLALALLDDQGAAVTGYTATAENGSLIISLKDLAKGDYIVKISGAGDDAATVSNTYSLDFNVYTWLDTFKATAVTKNSVALAWTAPAVASSLELEYSTDQDTWNPVTGVSLADEAATISGLTAATTYYVRIRAETGTDEYSAWSTVTVKTDDRYESNDSKAAVDALTAGATDSANLGALNGKTVIDNLVLVAGNDDFFRFEITEAGNAHNFVRIDFAHDQGDLKLIVRDSDGEIVAQSDSSSTTDGFELVSLNGMAAGVYYVEITGASSSVSNPDYTLTLRTPFSAPVLAAAQANSGDPVELTWTKPAGAESYSVWRQNADETWTRIASGLSTNAFTDSRAPNGKQKYMVYAILGSESKASDVATVTVAGALAAPVLTATVTVANTASLSWTGPTADATTTYSVWRQETDGSWTRIASKLETMGFVDGFAPTGEQTYMVYVHRNNDFKASNTASVTIKADLTAPTLTVTSVTGAPASLSWTESVGAESYSVWRKNPDNTWTRIASNVEGTAYVDGSAPDGTQTYKVYAVRGTESVVSNEASVTIMDGLSAPTLTGNTGSDGTVTLTWTEPAGAETYSVWREDGTGSWTRIASGLTTTTYVDNSSPEGSQSYMVYVHAGRESKASNVVTLSVSGALEAPTLTAAAQTDGTVELSWTAPHGAESYSVWRKNADGGWTRIANGLTTLEYVDRLASNGSQKYMVYAHRGDQFKASTEITVTVMGALEAPVVTAESTAPGTVNLTWTESPGAESYSVWRQNADGSRTRLANNLTEREYVDRSAPNGDQTYIVLAHLGTDFQASAPKTVTVTGALDAPVVSATSTMANTVNLSWTVPTGAENYSVWRQNAGGSWTRLANKLTATNFIDSSAPAGPQKYMVYAYRGTEYKASEVVSVTVLGDEIDSLAEIL